MASEPGANSAVKLPSLTLAGTSGDWTAHLVLFQGSLIIEPTPLNKSATLATLQDQVAYGRSGPGGIFIGGLTLGAVLAVVDNAVTHFNTFDGQSVDANSILITLAPSPATPTSTTTSISMTSTSSSTTSAPPPPPGPPATSTTPPPSTSPTSTTSSTTSAPPSPTPPPQSSALSPHRSPPPPPNLPPTQRSASPHLSTRVADAPNNLSSPTFRKFSRTLCRPISLGVFVRIHFLLTSFCLLAINYERAHAVV